MELIEQNPYRILGVLSNSSKKEIVANFGKIKAFSKTGKTLSFENDFSKILKPMVRNEESSAKAYNAITLPKDKLSAGLFWFMQFTNFDEIALNHLRTGNIESAITVLRKKPTVSSCINLAVINLIKGNWTTALYYYVYLLNDAEKRIELLSIITDNPDLLSEDEVVQVFVDKLLSAYPNVAWMESLNQKEVLLGDKAFEIKDFFIKSNVYNYFSKKNSEVYIKRLDSILTEASNAEGDNAKKNLKAAKTVEDNAKLILRSLRISLGKDNREYKSYCDKVANQILDNCIDYYNHDKDNPLRARNIIQLLRFALRTADGRITKDRCKNNYDHIKSECDALIPEEIESEINYINKQISEFKRLNSVSNYAGYLNATLGACFQKLEVIKTNVGPESQHYFNTSSNVVHFGIDVIVDEVNAKMNEYNKAPEYNNAKELLELRRTLKWGKPIFDILKSFAKDSTCSERFTKSFMQFGELYEKYHAESLDVTDTKSVNLSVNAPSFVSLNQKFSIQFSINCKGDISFAPPLLNSFELLSGPKKTVTDKETIYTYELMAKTVGSFVITSASAKIGNKVVNSSVKTIRVLSSVPPKEPIHIKQEPQIHVSKPTDKPNLEPSRSNKKDSIIGWVFGIILAVIVIFISINQCNRSTETVSTDTPSNSSTTEESNVDSYTSTESTYSSSDHSINSYEEETYVEPTPEPSYTTIYYKTGDRPYQSYYGKGRYDSDTENSLLIKNGSTSDAVVFLETLSGKKVRHVYVRKGDSFRMTQIPGGKYITKIFQGNSWNPDKYNGDSAPSGGFMEDVSMSKSEDYDPFDYPYPSSGHYYDYEITLYKVTNGNMHTENINSTEMFN